MATYDYWREQNLISPHPGLNTWFIHLDFTIQNMQTADVLRIAKVKNHWILKSGLTRATTPTTAAATADLGTTTGGQEIGAGIDLDNASDVWVRAGTLDDDVPVPIEADGYLYFECLDAAIYDGVMDIMLEVIMDPFNAE